MWLIILLIAIIDRMTASQMIINLLMIVLGRRTAFYCLSISHIQLGQPSKDIFALRGPCLITGAEDGSDSRSPFESISSALSVASVCFQKFRQEKEI
jgi:hypothetical protein